MDQGDQTSRRLDRRLDIVRVDHAPTVTADTGDLDIAGLLQIPQRPQYRIVFDHAGHDMVARPQQTVQRLIQGIGSVAGEKDAMRLWGADQVGQAPPRLFDQPLDFVRLAVSAAPGRRAELPLIVVDGCVDRFRLGPTGCGVVQIDPLLVQHPQPPI
jgi:hypothetical protein